MGGRVSLALAWDKLWGTLPQKADRETRTMPFTKPWTEVEKKRLREHFPFVGSKALSEAYDGRSAKALNDMAQRCGVKKSPERLREMGRENVGKRRETPEGKSP
jgi:hypothetical protein